MKTGLIWVYLLHVFIFYKLGNVCGSRKLFKLSNVGKISKLWNADEILIFDRICGCIFLKPGTFSFRLQTKGIKPRNFGLLNKQTLYSSLIWWITLFNLI